MTIPIILLGHLGAELWTSIALGPEYAAAAPAFRVCMATIALTYAAIILSMGLVAHGREWSVSSLSLTSVFAAPGLCAIGVPLFRDWLGPGGQATAAGVALGVSELIVVVLSIARIGPGVLQRRSVWALGKALLSAALVVLLDRLLSTHLGYGRLVIDMLVLAALMLGTRAVNLEELRELGGLLKQARREG